LFESIERDDPSRLLRGAAVPPLAALVFALLYLTVYPLFPRVPAALFWLVALVLLTGSVAGLITIVRVVRENTVRGRALVWLLGALALALVCARMSLAMILPWL
jgi:hypothetical protein